MHQTFWGWRRRMDFVCPLNIIDKSSFYDQGFGKGVLLTQPKWLDYQLLTLHYQRSCKMVVINKNFLNCGWVSTAFRNLDKKSFYFRAITHMFNMTLSVFFNDFTALHHRQFCTIENTLHLKNHSIEIHMINQYSKRLWFTRYFKQYTNPNHYHPQRMWRFKTTVRFWIYVHT